MRLILALMLVQRGQEHFHAKWTSGSLPAPGRHLRIKVRAMGAGENATKKWAWLRSRFDLVRSYAGFRE